MNNTKVILAATASLLATFETAQDAALLREPVRRPPPDPAFRTDRHAMSLSQAVADLARQDIGPKRRRRLRRRLARGGVA
jgi:hypothetical protein